MKKLLFIATVFLALTMKAQDIHFSQFHLMPMQLNPAMTGFFDGEARVGAIYRNQWSSIQSPYGKTKFETIGAYVDGSFLKGKLKNDYLGAGLSFFHDRAGDMGLSTNDISLNLAYSKGFGLRVKHSIAIGLQAEVILKNIQNGGAKFSDGIQENLGRTNFAVDGTVGVRYHVEFRRRLNMYIGFAYAHVARSTETFLNVKTEKLYAKYIVNAGAQIDVNDKINLVPTFMFLMQGPSLQANVGINAQFIFGDSYTSRNYFSVGVSSRFANPTPDAVIPNVRIDYKNITLGVAYDVNVSSLTRATSSFGAIEVGLMYVYKKKERKMEGRATCPKF
jgi:type IX secretion system PorP/SprF family membrane protein